MLGNHILVEFYGCDYDALNDEEMLGTEMVQAAYAADATVVDRRFHKFSPYGVSGVVVLAESHLTIHTWPEHGYAAVDLFTCGDTVDPWKAFDHLKAVLKSTNVSTVEMKRGRMADIEAANKKEICA
jgi:S-adenosylmethionine decarboxylase proenzyme